MSKSIKLLLLFTFIALTPIALRADSPESLKQFAIKNADSLSPEVIQLIEGLITHAKDKQEANKITTGNLLRMFARDSSHPSNVFANALSKGSFETLRKSIFSHTELSTSGFFSRSKPACPGISVEDMLKKLIAKKNAGEKVTTLEICEFLLAGSDPVTTHIFKAYNELEKENQLTLESLKETATETAVNEQKKELIQKLEYPNEEVRKFIEDLFKREILVNWTRTEIKNIGTPMLGRENELKRAIQTLLTNTRPNILLLGPPGAGKTFFMKGLAREFLNPKWTNYGIFGTNLLTLDFDSFEKVEDKKKEELLVAFLKHNQTFGTDRDKSIKYNFYVDEAHTIPSAFLQRLKKITDEGQINVTFSTTFEEAQAMNKDGAIERRFEYISLEFLPIDNFREELKGEATKKYLEKKYRVKLSDDVIDFVIKQVKTAFPTLPPFDKFFHIIDKAQSNLKFKLMEKGEAISGIHEIKIEHVRGATNLLLGMPENFDAAERIEQLKNKLFNRFGKDKEEAVTQIINAVVYAIDQPERLNFIKNKLNLLMISEDPAVVTAVAEEASFILYNHTKYYELDCRKLKNAKEEEIRKAIVGIESYYQGGQIKRGPLPAAVDRKGNLVLIVKNLDSLEEDTARKTVIDYFQQVATEKTFRDVDSIERDISRCTVMFHFSKLPVIDGTTKQPLNLATIHEPNQKNQVAKEALAKLGVNVSIFSQNIVIVNSDLKAEVQVGETDLKQKIESILNEEAKNMVTDIELKSNGEKHSFRLKFNLNDSKNFIDVLYKRAQEHLEKESLSEAVLRDHIKRELFSLIQTESALLKSKLDAGENFPYDVEINVNNYDISRCGRFLINVGKGVGQ